jgi:hypothetical protein
VSDLEAIARSVQSERLQHVPQSPSRNHQIEDLDLVIHLLATAMGAGRKRKKGGAA